MALGLEHPPQSGAHEPIMSIVRDSHVNLTPSL